MSRSTVLQLQLVGQSQDLDVCSRQAGIISRLLGKLSHCEFKINRIRKRFKMKNHGCKHVTGCASLTESDVFWERFFEVKLVGKKRQVLFRLFVPNFINDILQCVDILPDLLK